VGNLFCPPKVLIKWWAKYFKGSSQLDVLLEAQSNSVDEFEMHERTGRPLGSEGYTEMAESLLGRNLRKKKPGPKILNDN